MVSNHADGVLLFCSFLFVATAAAFEIPEPVTEPPLLHPEWPVSPVVYPPVTPNPPELPSLPIGVELEPPVSPYPPKTPSPSIGLKPPVGPYPPVGPTPPETLPAPSPAPYYGSLPPVKQEECPPLCEARCAKHSRMTVCMRACTTCCTRCKCVPPGTYGNKLLCGRCYADMTTHGGRLKCP
ncbi:hypothetical protein vseg_005902 [Gypsophila vaccaria]